MSFGPLHPVPSSAFQIISPGLLVSTLATQFDRSIFTNQEKKGWDILRARLPRFVERISFFFQPSGEWHRWFLRVTSWLHVEGDRHLGRENLTFLLPFKVSLLPWWLGLPRRVRKTFNINTTEQTIIKCYRSWEFGYDRWILLKMDRFYTSGEVTIRVLKVTYQFCNSEFLGSFRSLSLPPLWDALLDQFVLLMFNQVSNHLLFPLVLPHSRGKQ